MYELIEAGTSLAERGSRERLAFLSYPHNNLEPSSRAYSVGCMNNPKMRAQDHLPGLIGISSSSPIC